MQTEIATDPLREADLRDDFKAGLGRMKALGVSDVSLLFGFSWGSRIYQKKWKDIPVSPDNAVALVQRAEELGYGRLGNDNLYLSVGTFNLRLQYSHEAVIHLSFSKPNPLVRDILDRWNRLHWLCYNQTTALKKVMGRGLG